MRLTAAAPIPQDFLDICADAKIATHMLDPHIVNGGLLLNDTLISDPQILELDGRWMGPPLLHVRSFIYSIYYMVTKSVVNRNPQLCPHLASKGLII